MDNTPNCNACSRGNYHECIMCDFQPEENIDERNDETVAIPRTTADMGHRQGDMLHVQEHVISRL